MERVIKILVIMFFICIVINNHVLAVETLWGTVVSQALRCNVKVNRSDTVYVSDEYNENTEGWGKTRFNDLHEALAEVPENGKIVVECSRYVLKHSKDNKPLTISKNVTISGRGPSVTTIVIGGTFGNNGAIVVMAGRKLFLSNLTIEGYIYYTSFAILSTGGDVSLYNVKIQKINLDTNGCGIKVTNSSITGPGKLHVDNCSFNDIAGYAIYVYNSQAQIGVNSGNVFAGGCSRTQSDKQCAIRIENNSDVIIKNNNISGYNLMYAAGIYLKSGKAEICGNEILDCNIYNGIHINTGSTIGTTEVTADTAPDIAHSLSQNNSASVGIYDAITDARIYPLE